MSVDRFRFVSPGVFINEIDETQIPGPPALGAGPVVIGVSAKGPALVPVTVSTYKDFVDLFGAPQPGSTRNSDTWRLGNRSNPTYGAYAARAYLANASPLTYIRLVGDQDPQATEAAGWEVPDFTSDEASTTGGTYGLFIIGTGSANASVAATATIVGTAALAAETATSFILTNADDSTVTFTTDPTLNFADVTAGIGDHEWRVNTGGSFASDGIRKATQAAWIACKGAIDAGELDMTILPTSFAGTEEEFTLTQTTAGNSGNTAITLITGITADGATAFAGGVNSNGHGEGMLAAVFYLSGTATTIGLSGNVAGVSALTSACAALIEPVTVGNNKEYKIRIEGPDQDTLETTFNFNPKSGRYIRKVFNTNPQVLNPAITADANKKNYFLGQSYERAVIDYVEQLEGSGDITRSDFSNTYGVIIGLSSGSAKGGDFKRNYQTPATPWIVGQDLSDNSASFDINSSVEQLFRIHSRDDVEYAQRNYKISFSDIKASPNSNFNPYGTFSLLVRSIRDTDENPVILEQFDNLNLNPASNGFIGKRIGTRTFSWDTVNKKWDIDGEYDVQSKYIRVELTDQVAAGDQEATLLPFGFRGLPIHRGFNIAISGTRGNGMYDYDLSTANMSEGAKPIFADGGAEDIPNPVLDIPGASLRQGAYFADEALIHTASLLTPALPQRARSDDGRLLKETNAFWGLTTNQADNTLLFDGSIRDMVTTMPEGIAAGMTILSPGFSLDDLAPVTAGDHDGSPAKHSGSDPGLYFDTIAGSSATISALSPYRGTPTGGRRAGTSYTAVSGTYTEVLDLGYDRFTVPLYGGFDGFDITERNPFNNTRALGGPDESSITTAAYPMYYTLKKAIDSVSDVDQININMAAIPGVTDIQVTDYLLAMAEDRKDVLAVIDLEGGYLPVTEGSTTGPVAFNDRRGSSASTVTKIDDRDFNTSYGCTYYPWVQINDTAASTRVWVPPSTIAMGVLAASSARSELWFAPAGFNRGGLSRGSAGLNVINVIEKLTADQRDDLYEVNINPIASFPAEGIVVFGQKTLQATPSALDRINVRRLMIYLRKQITIIANGILFDPNVQITWNRFTNRVDPFLNSIKQRFGLSDYRVVLDESTTTPDLVDRNIMYAKILLKPTRAIEFIALDFVITRTGVEF